MQQKKIGNLIFKYSVENLQNFVKFKGCDKHAFRRSTVYNKETATIK
jgi:hypothetical protein